MKGARTPSELAAADRPELSAAQRRLLRARARGNQAWRALVRDQAAEMAPRAPAHLLPEPVPVPED